MNRTLTGFQVIDLSEYATKSVATLAVGLYDKVKKLLGSEKSYIVKTTMGAYILSNADIKVLSNAVEIYLPISYNLDIHGNPTGTYRYAFIISSADTYTFKASGYAPEASRPTVQAISILNANFSIATGETEQQIVLSGNDGITNGAYIGVLARQGKVIPGDGMLVSIAGKITDVDKSIEDAFFRVEVPCYVEDVHDGDVRFEYNLTHSVDTDIPVYVTGQKYYIRGSYWTVGENTEITLLLYPAI